MHSTLLKFIVAAVATLAVETTIGLDAAKIVERDDSPARRPAFGCFRRPGTTGSFANCFDCATAVSG